MITIISIPKQERIFPRYFIKRIEEGRDFCEAFIGWRYYPAVWRDDMDFQRPSCTKISIYFGPKLIKITL